MPEYVLQLPVPYTVTGRFCTCAVKNILYVERPPSVPRLIAKNELEEHAAGVAIGPAICTHTRFAAGIIPSSTIFEVVVPPAKVALDIASVINGANNVLLNRFIICPPLIRFPSHHSPSALLFQSQKTEPLSHSSRRSILG